MNKTYLFCLKDEVAGKQCGIWALDTNLGLGEIVAKFRALFSKLSTRWAVYIIETQSTSASTESLTTVKILAKIRDRIKEHEKESTVILLPPNNPWSKTDEHRKTLE